MKSDSMRVWIEQILPGLFKDSELKPSLKKFCYEGIPNAVRSRAWQLMIGNSLQITPDLYDILKAKSSQVQLSAKDETVIKNSISTGTCSPFCEESSYPEKLRASDLIISPDKPRSDLSLIDIDIIRTKILVPACNVLQLDKLNFPTADTESRWNDRVYCQINDTVRSIIYAFVDYRPDIGYVQGMTYIVTMLSLYLDEYNAFCCFANLLCSKLNFNFYSLKFCPIQHYVKIFNLFFKHYLPELFAHFNSENICSDMFIIDWYLTLFTKVLPLHISVRIWDIYFVEGEVFLLRVALAILRLFSSQFRLESIEAIVNSLTRGSQLENISIETLLAQLGLINISQSQYERARSIVQRNDLDFRLPPGCHRQRGHQSDNTAVAIGPFQFDFEDFFCGLPSLGLLENPLLYLMIKYSDV